MLYFSISVGCTSLSPWAVLLHGPACARTERATVAATAATATARVAARTARATARTARATAHTARSATAGVTANGTAVAAAVAVDCWCLILNNSNTLEDTTWPAQAKQMPGEQPAPERSRCRISRKPSTAGVSSPTPPSAFVALIAFSLRGSTTRCYLLWLGREGRC